MRLIVEHQTQYEYSEMVRHAIQRIYLQPVEGAAQRVVRWSLSGTGEVWSQPDAHGNTMALMVVDKPTQVISIRVSGEVDVLRPDARLGLTSPEEASAVPVAYFLRATPLTEASEELLDFGRTHLHAQTREGLIALASAIEDKLTYTPGATDVGSTALEAWAHGAGVCQDHAHVMIAICRSMGLPARYVSGYLAGEARASEATHAWMECWVEGQWQGIDATHRCGVGDRWLRLAVGADYEAVSPVRGVRRGGGVESMRVVVSVHQG